MYSLHSTELDCSRPNTHRKQMNMIYYAISTHLLKYIYSSSTGLTICLKQRERLNSCHYEALVWSQDNIELVKTWIMSNQ